MITITNNSLPYEILEEIAQNLPPQLRSYYEDRIDILDRSQDGNSFEDYILDVLIQADVKEAVSVSGLLGQEQEKRKKRRQDWKKKTLENIEQYPDPLQPESFFHPWYNILSADPSSLMSKFNTSNPTEIMELAKTTIPLWYKQKGMLIEFPNFPYTGKFGANVVKCFQSDLLYFSLRYIQDAHDGYLVNFKQPQMTRFDESPVFTAQKGYEKNVAEEVKDSQGKTKLHAREHILSFKSNEYSVGYDLSSITPEQLHVNSNSPAIREGEKDTSIKYSFRLFDTTDNEILSQLILNVQIEDSNTKSGQEELTPMYQIGLNKLASNVFKTKRPSKNQMDTLRERLLRLVTPIEVTTEYGTEKWVLVQHVNIIDAAEDNYAVLQYTLGNVIVEALINNKIRNLSSVKYNLLTSDPAKQLYVYLVLERKRLVQNNSDKLRCELSYAYFRRILSLRASSLSKDLKMIRDALDELKEKGLLIDSYEIHATNYKKNAMIILHFLPLTEAEYRDLFADNKPILEISSMENSISLNGCLPLNTLS